MKVDKIINIKLHISKKELLKLIVRGTAFDKIPDNAFVQASYGDN